MANQKNLTIRVLAPLSPTGGASGGTLASEDLAKSMERLGSVERVAVFTFGSMSRASDSWTAAEETTLRKLRGRGLGRALMWGEPLSTSRFRRKSLAVQIASYPETDVVVALTPATWEYARIAAAKRRLLVAFNVEADLYDRAVTNERNPIRRLVWQREARAMHEFEGRALREADCVVCLGDRDRLALKQRYNIEAVPWFPAVPGAKPTRRRTTRGCVVGMLGTMTWQPNRWGAEWFLREVWPRIVDRRHNAVELRIAGIGSESLAGIGAPGVTTLGRVDCLDDFFDELDLVVAPVRGGGGLKIKVLDASARGLPVVTTSAGIEGMGSEIPSSIAVIDDPDGFATAVLARLSRTEQLPARSSVAWYTWLVSRGEKALRHAILSQEDVGDYGRSMVGA